MPAHNFRDLTGLSFDRLTVIKRTGINRYGYAQWLCQCTCGNTHTVSSDKLGRPRGQAVKSCGCLGKENQQQFRTHGLSHLPEFYIWSSMRQRCSNPHRERYAEWGGRGITVCEAWDKSFATFYADMGPRPTPEHSLDRYPDNNGTYSPENCRWTTRHEQARNRRTNILLTWCGHTECVADWAKITGICNATLLQRKRLGWTDERILTTPPDVYFRRGKKT
jgi:hypothetical protein